MGRKKNNHHVINCTTDASAFNKDTSIAQKLAVVDELYDKDPALLGISALSSPCFNNSARMCMFTSHTKQYVCLTETDFPYYYMGSENIVGENNDAFISFDNETEVIAKLTKFDDLDRAKNKSLLPQYVIIRDCVTDVYDIIIRKEAENLTETFGYEYNNSALDSYNVGDIIPPNKKVVKSTSYDEFDNYGFGQNVLTAFTLSPDTYEDACFVSESLAKRMVSLEIDDCTIDINSNDYPLLLRKDEYDGYKIMPDIGEETGGMLAAVRTLYNNQALSDFNSNSIHVMKQSDKRYYIDGEVIDIQVFCNDYEYLKKRNSFNSQINDYYESQSAFYEKFISICKDLIKKGKTLSSALKYQLSRAEEFYDQTMIWRLKPTDAPFGGLKINILVRKKVGIGKGQKITGRAGNKSIVASIRPDDEMPMLDDGRHVDLAISTLSIINRTTGLPVHETGLTFITMRLVEQLKMMTNVEDKASLFFEVLDEINPDESAYYKDIYDKLDEDGKISFFTDIERDGVYIRHSTLNPHKSPFMIYRDLELKYDWIKPYKMYIKKFGRRIQCLNDAYVGYMYVMKLKQNSINKFSARSTGSINKKSLPERSCKNKSHQELYSNTAVRSGENETYTLNVAVYPEDLALFHQIYRTSIAGRRDSVKQLLDPESRLTVKDSYTNRSAEILNTFAKSMGFQFKIRGPENILQMYNNSYIKQYDGCAYTKFGSEWDQAIDNYKEYLVDSILDDEPKIPYDILLETVTSKVRKKFGKDVPVWDIPDIIDKLRYEDYDGDEN